VTQRCCTVSGEPAGASASGDRAAIREDGHFAGGVMAELVHVEVDDAVATLTLDSPANRNALGGALTGQLLAALEATATDELVRVVLLRSSGPVFCSGADMREAVDQGMETVGRNMVALQRAIVALPKPVVVRLDGPVRAGGLGLVGAADVVVTADSVSFAFTEVRLGLAAAMISMTCLERMGSRPASLRFLAGDSFDAHEAERIGLVTRAVPSAEVDTVVAEIVDSLRHGTPQGLRETKAVLNARLLARIDADGERLAALSTRLFASDEARAAMRAFLDRKSR
jgi:enoyl-CoA hydratase/carnithine racemase